MNLVDDTRVAQGSIDEALATTPVKRPASCAILALVLEDQGERFLR